MRVQWQEQNALASMLCYLYLLLLSRLLIHDITIAVLQSAPRVVATLCRGGEESYSSQLGLVSPVSSMTSLISPLPVMAAGPH